MPLLIAEDETVIIDKIGPERTYMKANSHRNGIAAKRVTVNGKRMVMLEETEFDRLLAKADEFEPLLPDPLPDGNYPAVEYARASLALKIVRNRRRLGLTQADLAKRANIRPESLSRIEHGRVEPSIRTVDKIDRAFREAEMDESKRAKSRR